MKFNKAQKKWLKRNRDPETNKTYWKLLKANKKVDCDFKIISTNETRLGGVMHWAKSKEGHKFWNDIDNRINQELDNATTD